MEIINYKYYKILENNEMRILKTKVSQLVLDLMFAEYKELTNKEDTSFQKFLLDNGIDSIYDGTFGYLDITI